MGTSAPTRNWSNFILKSGCPVCRPYAQRQQTTARQSQVQNGNRTSFNFPLSQPPVGRQEFRWPLRFCAPEILFYLTGTRPHVNGGSRGRAAWRQGRRSRFCRLRPPPSVFEVNWPEGPREGGLGHWFLFHVEKELAAGAAPPPAYNEPNPKSAPSSAPVCALGHLPPRGKAYGERAVKSPLRKIKQKSGAPANNPPPPSAGTPAPEAL